MHSRSTRHGRSAGRRCEFIGAHIGGRTAELAIEVRGDAHVRSGVVQGRWCSSDVQVGRGNEARVRLGGGAILRWRICCLPVGQCGELRGGRGAGSCGQATGQALRIPRIVIEVVVVLRTRAPGERRRCTGDAVKTGRCRAG